MEFRVEVVVSDDADVGSVRLMGPPLGLGSVDVGAEVVVPTHKGNVIATCSRQSMLGRDPAWITISVMGVKADEVEVGGLVFAH